MSFWKDKKVFVTGASGFVGGHLVRRLLKEKASVICLIRSFDLQTPILQEKLDGLQVVQGSLQDFDRIELACQEHEVDTIFHIGAQAIVSTANLLPKQTLETNVQGTWNILEVARRMQHVKVIVASSDKAYGEGVKLPYTEKMPLMGKHPYDVSKSCADLISTCYASSYNIPIAIARCGNIFGPGDRNFSRLIPCCIKAYLEDVAPKIRSDGHSLRDYIYIDDVVNSYLLLAEHLKEDLYGEAFNFGHGNPQSVIQIVEKIQKIMGKEDLSPHVLSCAKRR